MSDLTLENREWAKLLWEECKYRHEAFWSKFYRSVWAVIVCAAIPWVTVSHVQIFAEARKSFWFRLGYVVFVFAFFGGTAFLLCYEHLKLKSVVYTLQEIRGKYQPPDMKLKEEFRRDPLVRRAARSYLTTALVILLIWALKFLCANFK